jgi:diguanylate cyclase (GGDEF)-like protein
VSALLNILQQPIQVLVVDDDEAILDLYCRILTGTIPPERDSPRALRNQLFGDVAHAVPPPYSLFNVLYRRNAEQAVAAVAEALAGGKPFSVVFLDLQMPPGPDGAWAAARIRESDPNVNIVMVTAANIDPREIAAQAPPEEKLFYVRKPFHLHEIRQLALTLGRRWEADLCVCQLAYYDHLTGLPNRGLFVDRLAQALVMARRHQHQAAVLFIDLDNFKRIHDTLGHGSSNQLLKIMAGRLLSHPLQASDASAPDARYTAARLGGDEFAVLLSGIDAEDEAAIVAQRLLDILGNPMCLVEREVTVTASIGIALFPQDGDDVESLLKSADLAMNAAKRMGSNRFQSYQESMHEMALRRLLLEDKLRGAIERDELTLHYQPQVNLLTGKISGMEALLRWNSVELGNVSPVEFIPVAEESGLIVQIGEWVLRTACRQVQRWRERGVPIPRIAVNVAMPQFTHARFLDTIKQVLVETGLDPEVLELEITESLLMKDPQSIATTLHALRNLGIQIAVDDFGTGYSSLSRLKELPIDCLKIDRAFVSGIDVDSSDRAITSAVIAMADGLKLRVIAEGVETAAQAEFLHSNRCGEMQGFLVSRPLPAEQTEFFLRQFAAARVYPAHQDFSPRRIRVSPMELERRTA